jgi:hypothetical protein
MQGTRLPDAVMGEPGPGWDAWEELRDGVRQNIAPPGAYLRVTSSGKFWCWYVKSPSGNICTLRDNHQVTEHPDGTITVAPSIVFPHSDRWHGFLRRGVWSSV